jgi:hypothetical protein
MFPFLLRKEVEDQFAQENFLRIQDYFKSQAVDRCSFEFLEIPVVDTVTGLAFQHRLGFVPKDIITLHNSTNATVTWQYLQFTSTNLILDVSAATTLRILAGRYQ